MMKDRISHRPSSRAARTKRSERRNKPMETSQCTQLPTTARDVAAHGLPSGRLRLLIIGDGSVATYPLPDSGDVSFGRAETNDVQIEDASISRRHAVLHVGVQVTLEDLGSTN